MRFYDRIMIPYFAAALPQITNEFLAGFKLRARWLIAVEIAD